jgi:hypothetical protein
MKLARLSSLVLILLVTAAVAAAQPDYKERISTDPGRDLGRVSVKGKIESISGQKAVLKTEEGRTVRVNLGPEQYWRDRGYHLEAGSRVTVDGWGDIEDEDGGYIYAGDIYGPDFHFEICDSHGYPRWADRDDWDGGWYPSQAFFEVYFFGPPPYGPPLWWYYSPPRPWWRHHYPQYYGPPRGHHPDRGYHPRGGRHRR